MVLPQAAWLSTILFAVFQLAATLHEPSCFEEGEAERGRMTHSP